MKQDSIILPAIDIINGTCVRLTEGDPEQQKAYSIAPLAMAQAYEQAGATHVHIVDLDAAMGQGNNRDLIAEIIASTDLRVELGGGIKSESQIESWLEVGAWRLILGSVAVKNSVDVKRWIRQFGADRLVIGADSKDGDIMVTGWQESSKLSLFDFIEDYAGSGAQKFLCTDINRDGKMQGSSIDLYRELISRFPNADFIASGGVSSLQELKELKAMGVEGIIVGKAIFESAIELKDLFAI